MRILQLGKFYPVRGGVEKVMYDLMLGLADRGVGCDMMCAETAGSGNVRDLSTGARIISFHTWAKIASTTIAPSMINNLRSVADDYDIIHVHHPDPMAAIALRFSGYQGPVVLHWHSDIIKSKPLMSVWLPIQEWLLKRADAIVTTSPVMIEQSQALKDYRYKTRCIPIGINALEEDRDGAAAIRRRYGDRKIIFSLGRLVPYKGYRYLLEAAAALPGYVVLIGGEGPMQEELEALRGTLGVEDRVHFLGHIPDDSLPAYYSACDIFCLPSVMKTEAFGIVQIEAMSLGKPVVATRIEGSGTSWVNRHDVSGLNVTPCNPGELASALLAIGDNQENLARLGSGALARFNSEFTLGTMIDRCLELYRQLAVR